MLRPISVPRSACLGLALVLLGSSVMVAQVPTRASEPGLQPARERAAVPSQPTAAEPTAAAPQPVPTAAPQAAPAPAGVTPLPAAAPPPATASTSSAATAKDNRAYGGSNFSLTLDGSNAGAMVSANGGAALGEVIVMKQGPDHATKKHIGNIKYEPLSLEAGIDAKPLMDWIAATWKGNHMRKSGSVQAADYNYNVVGVRQFSQALIVGTTFPTLDASTGKAGGALTVTLAPEQVRQLPGSGKLSLPSKAKRWAASNFRFELGDLPGGRVSRIESFTVGVKVPENQGGELRDYNIEPTALEFPNLKVTLSQADAGPWAAWHDDFLINGNAGDDQEKNGAIVFLDPARREELGRVNLFNCGIFRFGAVSAEGADREKLGRVTADLYCERMELSVKN